MTDYNKLYNRHIAKVKTGVYTIQGGLLPFDRIPYFMTRWEAAETLKTIRHNDGGTPVEV